MSIKLFFKLSLLRLTKIEKLEKKKKNTKKILSSFPKIVIERKFRNFCYFFFYYQHGYCAFWSLWNKTFFFFFFGNFPFFFCTRVYLSVQTVELSPWPFWLGKRRKTYWPEFVAVVVFYPLISSRENDEYLMNENKTKSCLTHSVSFFPWIIFRNVVSGFFLFKKKKHHTTPFFSAGVKKTVAPSSVK